MFDLIFPDPRNNPEFKYFQVMSGYNYNFSAITSAITSISGGTTTFSGGTISSSINVLGNVTGNNFYISSTSVFDLFIATGDTIDAGFY